MFTQETIKEYGIKWNKKNNQIYGDFYIEIEEDIKYFYFFLNEDITQMNMGFLTKEIYDAGVPEVFTEPHINEIVIKNQKLEEFLVRKDFYKTIYHKYMDLYSEFYNNLVEGDIYNGIISCGENHYHYIAAKKLTGEYGYFMEELMLPTKPYMPKLDTRRQLTKFSFTNKYMETLA